MTKLKKLISIILALMVLAVLASCSLEPEQPMETVQGADNVVTQLNNDNNLGDYMVEIKGCRMAEDYQGNPIVIVTYSFTNNGDEAAAFYLSLEDEVYQVQTILTQYSEANGNMVELVIANNDDMALGAIAALQAAGYNKNDGGKTIPVFGVDATAAAQEAIAAKSMTGTIKQDAVGMANAVVKIAQNLVAGKGTFDDVVGDLEGTWRVNIPYSAYSG